ncbi:alkaline ceramidase, partial [Candidatus Bathyarchaeota archaeon]|nr:alkaline ceramidase [Candidatus Bathyarchaeota archaeon]
MKIKAGTSAVEIPVEPGTPMGGYGARSKPSTGTHDPLHASTLFIDVD